MSHAIKYKANFKEIILFNFIYNSSPIQPLITIKYF